MFMLVLMLMSKCEPALHKQFIVVFKPRAPLLRAKRRIEKSFEKGNFFQALVFVDCPSHPANIYKFLLLLTLMLENQWSLEHTILTTPGRETLSMGFCTRIQVAFSEAKRDLFSRRFPVESMVSLPNGTVLSRMNANDLLEGSSNAEER